MRKKALRPPTKTAVVCLDGPLVCQTLWLTLGATTLPFTIKGQTGFYCGGRWNAIS
jgi:hypothetical protein